MYGMISTLMFVFPVLFWSEMKRSTLTSLTTNVLYKYAWMGIGWGNLIIFGLPGLVWPVSLAGRPGFNGFYVQWQQYMTFYTGVSLNLIVVGLLFASYLTYESDASLD